MKILLVPNKHKGVVDSPTSTHLWKHYVVNATVKRLMAIICNIYSV